MKQIGKDKTINTDTSVNMGEKGIKIVSRQVILSEMKGFPKHMKMRV